MKNFIISYFSKLIGGDMTSILITLGIIAAAALLGVGSSFYLGDDNQVEEKCEEVIKSKTGLDVDLSPGSKEKKK